MDFKEKVKAVLIALTASENEYCRLYDDSDYVPGLSSNGGKYSYWTTYTKNADESFTITYGNSSDFGCCPVCGDWNDHWDEEAERYTCGNSETISMDNLVEEILEWKDKGWNYYVVFFKKDDDSSYSSYKEYSLTDFPLC